MWDQFPISLILLIVNAVVVEFLFIYLFFNPNTTRILYLVIIKDNKFII